MQRVLVRTLGLAAVLAATTFGVVHVATDDVVTAGGGHEPCMMYADSKGGGDYTTQPQECPPPDCEHSIGYSDGHSTYKPPECQPPSTPCTSAWVDEHGNAHSYDNCGTMPSTTKKPHETTTTQGGGETTTTCADCVPNTQTGGSTTTTGGGGGTTTTKVTTTTTGGGGTTTTRVTTTTTGGGSSTTTTSGGSTTSTSTSSTSSSTTSTTRPGTPPITGPATPEVFVRAAGTVCQTGVPKIQIDFGNEAQFNGRVGTLTMSDINNRILSVQPLTYVSNTTVFLLYPGTAVDPVTGEVTDVPGWNLNSDGFWVEDPSDAILRQGINLLYEVNPTATAFVTYPPESSGCATPTGPFPPVQPPRGGTPTSPPGGLPHTL